MKLGLIFTLGVSLETWHRQGLLDREKLLYEKLVKTPEVDSIYWFTYGSQDKCYQGLVDNCIKIIPMPRLFNSRFGKLIYSFLIPILKFKLFKQLDIIKTNQLKGGWSAFIAAKLYRKKLLVRLGYVWSLDAKRSGYRGAVDRFSAITERLVFKYADAVLTADNLQKEYILRMYNIDEAKIFIIPNYIDTETFKALGGISKFPDRVVCVGRISEEKNLESLIIALGNSGYGIDIYGSGNSKQRLKRISEEHNTNVDFKGNVPNSELAKILNRYFLFVLLSFYEGMPKALLEAMSCGLTVLCSDIDGINAIIEHNHNGWLLKRNKDTRVIKDNIDILMKDKQLMKRLGASAREYAQGNFSINKIVRKELEIYKNFY